MYNPGMDINSNKVIVAVKISLADFTSNLRIKMVTG